MAVHLKPIAFDPGRFEKELDALGTLLASKTSLSETKDLQPLFQKSKHLTAYMGTIFTELGPATELAFQYPFFGSFRADAILGSKSAKRFCVVEFEDGRRNSIFKIQLKRKHPEWSARFEHGFSQLTDWFYNLDSFKRTPDFIDDFGSGHIKFFGLLVIGRSASLDDSRRRRLDWRTEKVLVDSSPITCLTFDDLYTSLRNRFILYRAAAQLEAAKKPKNKK